ncbi:MAG: LamG-like jellyroll fold domain-containing protein, partial [Planctomycetota bacterium]
VGGASGLQNYFETGSPRSRQDATFELVFRVEDTQAGGDQVLLEAGGAARGVAFVLNGDQLTFNVDGNGGDINLTTEVGTGWRQVVGVIDLAGGGDSVALYLDGVLIGSLDGQNIVDWAGGNELGLGAGAGSVTGVTSGAGAGYHGQIALARFYAGSAFGLTEVQQNYLALADPFQQVATIATVNGDLVLNAGGVIELDVSDNGEADRLIVGEDLVLFGGELAVAYIGEDGLAAGDGFDLLDFTQAFGEFGSLALPTLAEGLMWDTAQLLISGTLSVTIAGDYNGDGLVDSADYGAWRNTLGQSVTPLTGADGNGDGFVNAADLDVWLAAFGRSVTGPAAVAAAPEPATGLSLLLLAAAAAVRRGRWS